MKRIFIIAFLFVILSGASLNSLAQPLVKPVAPPTETPTEEFVFAVFGDNRPEQKAIEQPHVYKQIIEEINKSSAVLATNTGDLVDGVVDLETQRLQFAEFIRVSRGLTPPLYTVIGNHDVDGRQEIQGLYLELICPKLYYSFDFNHCHFIFLDSETIGEEGSIPWEQLKWLAKDLKNVTVTTNHIFVFLHRPLFSAGPHKGGCLDRYPEERDELLKLFVRFNVNAIFCGHEHIYHKSVHNGVTQYITGGAGAPLHKNFDEIKDYPGAFYHYLLVKVFPKRYEVEVKILQGYGH